MHSNRIYTSIPYSNECRFLEVFVHFTIFIKSINLSICKIYKSDMARVFWTSSNEPDTTNK